MKARYQFRFYPTDQQIRDLSRLFGCVRVVWNDALAACKGSEKLPSYNQLSSLLTQSKQTEERVWLTEVSAVPLQQSVRNLNVAYQNFFNSVNGKRKGKKINPPRFKSRKSKQSATFTNVGFSIKGEKVYLAKIGYLDVMWSRPLPSEPSSVTVIKDAAGRYFLSFVVEINPEKLPDNGKSVGIDLGITDFATLDNGEKIKSPKPLKKRFKKLRKAQRNLSRKQKGSKRPKYRTKGLKSIRERGFMEDERNVRKPRANSLRLTVFTLRRASKNKARKEIGRASCRERG